MDQELTDLLRADLAGRYTIEQELGRGGMAVVYLAHDVRHNRRVALKVLKPDSGIAVAGDRFLREIQTVAQLHHPHILPLYDSGKAGDHLFYVMPYVEGESLRQRLERSGPLPVDETIRIAREVADALAFAHEHGVVHRDVKPENILLSSGHAVVADFGIARAADAAGLTLTDSGLAVGTPAYMSPEQVTADPKLDGRSDQYALGCVVYEMLAGSPPFYGATSQAIMARHTTDPMPPLVTVREVSPAIESAIRKALAKVPADRFETTRAFAEALSRSVVEPSTALTQRRALSLRATIVAAAAVVIIAVLAVAWIARPTSSAESLQSVAVLPVTTSGDTGSMTLADGITEGLHTQLVQVSGLGVLSPGRVEAYRDRATDPQQVGRALGVSAVVSGSLRRAGNRFRVTAQLTDVKTGRSVSHQFDGELIVDGHLQDIFTIQDEITARIVAALRPQLPPSDRASLARGVRTRNVEAYELYLQSKQIPLTSANAERAISLLRRAIQKDSTYADAYAELALWQFLLYGNPGNRPADVAIAIREAVERAIELDPQNARAIGNRGLLKLLYDWNFAGGLEDLRNAVRLNPADIDLVIIHAVYQGLLGRTDSSLVYARRATRIDPLNAFPWNNLGKVFAFAGMRDSAIWASERALVLDSTMWHTNFVLMHSYLDAGRRADADRAVDALLRHGGFEPGPMSMAAIYYARSHNRDGAQAMFRRVSEFAKTRYVPPTKIAAVRLGVGDRAGALSAIEEAARDHDLDLIQDLVFSYAPLNGDPRFEAVRKRVYGNWPMPRNPYPF